MRKILVSYWQTSCFLRRNYFKQQRFAVFSSGSASLVYLITIIFCFSAYSSNTEKLWGRVYEISNAVQNGNMERAHTLCNQQNVKLRHHNNQTLLPLIIKPADGVNTEMLSNDLENNSWGCIVDACSKKHLRILTPFSGMHNLMVHNQIQTIRVPYSLNYVKLAQKTIAQSVNLIGALEYHADNITGSGINVAVIDGGFEGFDDVVASGELPSNVQWKDFTNRGIETDGPHGTAVAEILYDAAPGIQLHLLKVGDLVDLELAAQYCKDNAIHVANLSVSWYGTSYYDNTGEFNTLINESRINDNVFWVAAAGNNAKSHWYGNWIDNDNDYFLDFYDNENKLKLLPYDDTIAIYLNWDEYDIKRKINLTDLNLYIIDEKNQIVESSTSPQYFTGSPLEYLRFSYDKADSSKEYFLVVEYYRGSKTNFEMTLYVRGGNIEKNITSRSVADPACAEGAFTVGAVGEATGPFNDLTIRSYSSQGPTNDGRLKPECTAPDGVLTTSYDGVFIYGTSFSAPLVSGVAALMLEKYPGVTLDELEEIILGFTKDFGIVGPDSTYGAGVVFIGEEIPTMVSYPLLQNTKPAHTRNSLLFNLAGQKVLTNHTFLPLHSLLNKKSSGYYILFPNNSSSKPQKPTVIIKK